MNTLMTFDTFIEDDSNADAVEICKCVVDTDDDFRQPILFWGASGCGKTHLLMAMKEEIEKKYPQKKVGYFTIRKIIEKFISEYQNNPKASIRFGEQCENYDMVLLENMEELAEKDGTQMAVYEMVKSLYEKRISVVMTMTTTKQPESILKFFFEMCTKNLVPVVKCDISAATEDLKTAYAMRTADELGLRLDDNDIKELVQEYWKIHQIKEALLKKKLHADLEGFDAGGGRK